MYDQTQTMDLIRKAVERHPNRRNPKADGACRYTSRNKKSHCIAGQLIVDTGGEAPPFDWRCGFAGLWCGVDDFFPEGSPERELSRHLLSTFDRRALRLIYHAQCVFDDSSSGHGTPRKWKNALVELERKYEEWYPSGV